FEKMLNEVEANYCVDTSKVFVGGFSSSAWFAATLSCSHGDRINAIGMAAGGEQPELPTCTGPTALALWAGTEDTGNPIDAPSNVTWKGSGAVRDRLVTTNGCSRTTTDWDPRWPTCRAYDDCGKNPVVFCPHPGGHDAGGDTKINSEGFWKLFKSTW
ncbi:MAG TPA: hypothetical protein VFQ35_26420, partial [Polyangiaceae bacterium]|nr:hypothetical protein [Polyangiaceae bacterium]